MLNSPELASITKMQLVSPTSNAVELGHFKASSASKQRSPALIISFAALTSASFAWEVGPSINQSRLVTSPLTYASLPYLEDTRVRLHNKLDVAREAAAHIDEDEGIPPSQRAFSDASSFIDQLPASIPVPEVYASGDAEVGFTWSLADRFLEVAFRGDGKLRWAGAFGAYRPGGEIAITMKNATRLPKFLSDLIDRL
jgi:hypothetical protein